MEIIPHYIDMSNEKKRLRYTHNGIQYQKKKDMLKVDTKRHRNN